MSGALLTKHRKARFVCHHDVTTIRSGAGFAQDADRERRILGRVARQAVEPDGVRADAAGTQPLRHVKAVAITADDHQGRQSPSIECGGAIRPFLGLAAQDDDGVEVKAASSRQEESAPPRAVRYRRPAATARPHIARAVPAAVQSTIFPWNSKMG